jgi:hypothetical protein
MTPYEILAGPLTLYAAPVGTAFPLVSAVPPGAWVKIGTNGDYNYEDDGVVVSHVQKIETARTAGATGPVKAWRTEEDLMISLKLMDISVEQYSIAMNAATVTTTAAGVGTPGTKKIGLSRGQNVVTYALLARGFLSAYGDNLAAQYEVPRAYQSANPKPVFKKGAGALLELEFAALEDLSAATAAERFGRLVHQHQVPL